MSTTSIARLILVSQVAFACNKGDPKPTLVLDEPTVSERLEGIGADVPGCDVATPAATSRVARETRGLISLLRLIPGGITLTAGTGSTGTCGGDAAVNYTHENGIDDYTVLLNNLCLTSADGNVTVNGTIASREIGTPSDNGPVMKSMELDTVGPIEVTQNGGSGQVEVTGLRAEYGKPEAWAPGVPDEANPDVVTLDRATVTFASDGRTEYLEGLRYERTGDFWTSTWNITNGKLGREGESFVTMSTVEGDPIVLSLGIQVQSGTLRLEGADNTELLVTVGDAPGVIDLELNGAPFSKGLDCTAGRQPLVEAGMALMSALPVR